MYIIYCINCQTWYTTGAYDEFQTHSYNTIYHIHVAYRWVENKYVVNVQFHHNNKYQSSNDKTEIAIWDLLFQWNSNAKFTIPVQLNSYLNFIISHLLFQIFYYSRTAIPTLLFHVSHSRFTIPLILNPGLTKSKIKKKNKPKYHM